MAKNYTYLFFSVTTLLCFSCSQEDVTSPQNGGNENKNTISSETLYTTNESDTSYTYQSTSYVSLITVEMEIGDRFKKGHFVTTGWTTQQYINKIDSLANLVTSFQAIKPTTYTVLSEQQANNFLYNYDVSYNQLNVSAAVKTYMDQILQVRKSVDLGTIYGNVQSDNTLIASEKQLLTYLIDSIAKNGDDHGDSPIWRKRKICAVVSGWQDSKAQAVFNATLVNVYNE